MRLADRKGKLCVLHCEGWRYYSRRFGSRKASLSYLCGEDDNGVWAVRIPGTIKNVKDALDWIKPSYVKKAEENKKRVLRQGDLYIVETKRDQFNEDSMVNRSHFWYRNSRVLVHDPNDGRKHRSIVVNFPCRFVPQSVYRMGRSNNRGLAD